MKNNISVFDCNVIDLGKISFDEGNLTVVENNSAFPFNVKEFSTCMILQEEKAEVRIHTKNVISS